MDISVLSPFPAYAWPLVWDWIQSFQSRVCDDFAPKTKDEFVSRYIAIAGLPHVKTWAVERDGEIGGLIWFERTEIAGIIHVIFKKSFWGSVTTVPALDHVADELFRGGTLKINAMFFADNHAVRAVVKSFGFVQEGVLRAQTLRNGIPVDMEPWGLLKEEFYGHRDRNRSAHHGSAGSRSFDGGRAEQQIEDDDGEQYADLHVVPVGRPGKVERGVAAEAE